MADLREGTNLALVIVDRAPRVLALHTEAGVESWIFVLPTGEALLIDTEGRVTAHTSLERIEARKARRGGVRIVEVVEASAEAHAA
jgi:hypothetical protein